MSAVSPHRHLSKSQWRHQVYADRFMPASSIRDLYASHVRTQIRHYSPDKSLENSPPATETITNSNPSRSWEPLQSKVSPRGSARSRHPQQKWRPYSDQGQNDLKSLAGALQGLESSQLPEGGYKPTRHLDLPQSPILKKALDRKQGPKSRPTVEERALARDPWAMILASPVRICNATRVRLPLSLLTNWALVKHPDTRDLYLLPNSLADLEMLEQMGSRQLEQSKSDQEAAKRYHSSSSEELMQSGTGHEEQGQDHTALEELDSVLFPEQVEQSESEEFSQSSFIPLAPTPLNPGSARAIRMLPSAELMSFLTDQFTYNAFPHNPDNPLRSKSSAPVLRIIPKQWRERLDSALILENDRKAVERATGIKDFRDEPLEATVNLKDLKWQPGIPDRLLDILRRRVVICMQRVFTLATSSPQTSKQRSVTALPQTLEGIGEGETRIPKKSLLAPNEDKLDDEDAFLLESTALPKRESPNEALGQPYLQPRIVLCFSPDPAAACLDNLPVSPIPGSRSTVALERDESDDASMKPNSFLPPLLAASPKALRDGRHSPVFPLHAMLGTKRYNELIENMKHFGSVFSSESAEQLISIRSAAAYSDVLFAEIWRLWRYVGGRACMEAVREESVVQRRDQSSRRQPATSERDRVGGGVRQQETKF